MSNLLKIARSVGGVYVEAGAVTASASDFTKQIEKLNKACPTGSFVKLGAAFVFYNANNARIFLRFGNKKSLGGPVMNITVLRDGSSHPTFMCSVTPGTEVSVLNAYGPVLQFIKEPKGKYFDSLKNKYLDFDSEVQAGAVTADASKYGNILVLLNKHVVSVEFAVKHGYLMSDEEIKSGTTSQAVDGVIDLVKDARKILAPMQDAMDAPSTVELSQWHGTMLQLLGNTNDLLRFIAAHYTAKDDKRFILKAQAELKSVLAAVKAKTAKADALAALVSIYATLGFVTQRYFIESAD